MPLLGVTRGLAQCLVWCAFSEGMQRQERVQLRAGWVVCQSNKFSLPTRKFSSTKFSEPELSLCTLLRTVRHADTALKLDIFFSKEIFLDKKFCFHDNVTKK